MDFIKKYKHILVPTLLILILILIFLTYYLIFSSNFLSGLWVCDDDFCTNSEINQLLFYIGGGDLFDTKKVCVLILDSNDIPYQFVFDMEYNPITKKMKLISDEESIFPDSMDMNLSFIHGSLILSDDEQEYARLYKDNINNV